MDSSKAQQQQQQQQQPPDEESDEQRAAMEAAEALRAAALIAGLEEAKRRAREDATTPIPQGRYEKIPEPPGGWRTDVPQQAQHTPEEVAAALRQAHGLIAGAAKMLNMGRSTVFGYTRRYRVCADAIEEARETMKDLGEGQLYVAVQRGEPWAVQFYLRTQARDRGYGDHIDVAVVLQEEAARLSAETGIDIEVLKQDAQKILGSARGRVVELMPGENGTWAPEEVPDWRTRGAGVTGVDAGGHSWGEGLSHEGEVTPEIKAARKKRRKARREAQQAEHRAYAQMMPGAPEHRGAYAKKYEPDGRPIKYQIDGKRVGKAEWEVWRRAQRDAKRARRGKPPVTDVRYAHPAVVPDAEILRSPRRPEASSNNTPGAAPPASASASPGRSTDAPPNNRDAPAPDSAHRDRQAARRRAQEHQP